MPEQKREENAIILDFLKHGYPSDDRPMHRKTSIAQALGKEYFTLLELVPKKDVHVQPYEEVYIGDGKREKIHHVNGKVRMEKLTETAKSELDHAIKQLVEEQEERFVDFFNDAQPMSTRMHALELLPGVGKKHMREIVEARRAKDFESFEDIRERVNLLPDPKKLIIHRIMNELKGKEKHNLFVNN